MNYTIFSIDESRSHYKALLRNRMLGWYEYSNMAVNGNDRPLLEAYRGIHDYEVNFEARVGQLGIWYGVLNALDYAPLVTFEDDALLNTNFTAHWALRYNHLPEDIDFFALFIPRDSDHLFVEASAVNKYITPIYQNYGGVSMYYTEQGAEKIKALLRRDGLTAQYDEQLLAYAKAGELNGYCSRPDVPDLVYITGEEKSIVQESEWL